ncbi:hypothetical protein N7468_002006 [Penicillium chermesinum]|uniref:Dynein intermediate chain n=1 Tax=Penicillium chermesinum TaxID=63820 RepID=A0A9W9PHP8_9EURO|nr:uncharacterized protein N7468_002006 [Penicillium chermesinum]KAJ5247023.1 hypothetical protein N7468_002006 [Penicillium chermesinum]
MLAGAKRAENREIVEQDSTVNGSESSGLGKAKLTGPFLREFFRRRSEGAYVIRLQRPPQRKNEILAKRAKLAELKKQREIREKEFTNTRNSVGDASEIASPVPSRSDHGRAELDDLISRLVDRPGSASISHGIEGAGRGSRPNSVLSASQLSGENAEPYTPSTRPQSQSIAVQTVGEEAFVSKAVQTDLSDEQTPSADGSVASDEEDAVGSKRLSRRNRERDEEIREKIRKEIEEELRYPLRMLDDDELKAVTSSGEFLDFVERSAKVIERALDEDYDVLADYELGGLDGDLEEDPDSGKKRRGIKEICQFYDERWSKKRMVSDLNFSPKFPELVVASYTKNPSAPHEPDGLVQVWNQHLTSRPEYVFHSTSDILTAKFSPFHPNIIVGGSYSGQVLLWDTRSSREGGGAPVQKTPLTGSGHTHPVYSISIVGTQNAHNIMTASTDGVVCGWTMEMLSQPQEYLELTTPPPSKTEDLAPTTMSFPQSDPTFFIVGTEEGGIYPCHRYDRAGAKAGTDHRLAYRGHAAPIMSTAFHPARGPVDLGDLMLSTSVDWSVKLWRISTARTWSTMRAGPLTDPVFSLVDGGGHLEVWDLYTDTEIPVVRTTPSNRLGGLSRSLNKVAWEEREGRHLATGGLNGAVTIFEVGKGLGGLPEEVPAEEWMGMKRLISRLESTDRVV